MANFKIKFAHIDNWVNVYVNDLCVASHGSSGVTAGQSLDITKFLMKGDNTVRVDGVNYGPWRTANPFNFKYSITQDNTEIAAIFQRSNVSKPTPGASYVGASSSLVIVV